MVLVTQTSMLTVYPLAFTNAELDLTFVQALFAKPLSTNEGLPKEVGQAKIK